MVNLRAALSRRALRYETLGSDLDGRIYYVLSPRPVEDGGRPPLGWGSGLLVWGMGVPRKPDAEVGEEDLPIAVERWSHFGKSATVRQLAKWVQWRTKKAADALRPAKSPARPKAASSLKGTPAGKATLLGKATPKTGTSVKPSPSKLVQSTLYPTPSKAPPKARRSLLFDIIIPISAKKASASDDTSSLSSISGPPSVPRVKTSLARPDDDATSSSSGLSSPPSSSREELLALVAPKDYKPTASVVEEEGKELVRRLHEVAEWLAVLEWKGMGEVY